MGQNLFNSLVAQSTTHDFFSDAKFPIRIRPVTLPANVAYLFGTPLTTTDGINYTVSGTGIKCLLANSIDTDGLTDPRDREVAAYFTGGFNQNVVEFALQEATGNAAAALTPAAVATAREIQIDIWPWQEAPMPITFPGGV